MWPDLVQAEGAIVDPDLVDDPVEGIGDLGHDLDLLAESEGRQVAAEPQVRGLREGGLPGYGHAARRLAVAVERDPEAAS